MEEQYETEADDPFCPDTLFDVTERAPGLEMQPCELTRLWPDEQSGECTFRVPLKLSPGQSGFGPDHDLKYRSSDKNGSFGLGWSIDVPYIERRDRSQAPGVSNAGSIYLLNDEELVPALRGDAGSLPDEFTVGDYLVVRYRRRFEHAYERIERWLHQSSGDTQWQVVDRNNVASCFGSTGHSRVADPDDGQRVLRWLLNERFDDRGNIIGYRYKPEDLLNVDLDVTHERHRLGAHNAQGGNRYLKEILYGNITPHNRTTNDRTRNDSTTDDRNKWCFRVVFDYGEHRQKDPSPGEDYAWPTRPDPFSSHLGGFEVRTWRRCQRVLQYHHFDELGPEPYLVSSISLGYLEDHPVSLLNQVVHGGHLRRSNDITEHRCLPPLRFRYYETVVDDKVRTVDEFTAQSYLAKSKPHRSPSASQAPRHPQPVSVGASVMAARPAKSDRSQGGASSRSLSKLQITENTNRTVKQSDSYIGYLDLNDDGHEDMVIADGNVLRWYPSQNNDGFGDPIVLPINHGDQSKARCLYSSTSQSLHLADMTGDGLADLIRVRSGKISYFPNRGRGRFGESVCMTGSDQFSLSQGGDCGVVLLTDLTGSGTSDLVWVGDGEIRYRENWSGNRFGPEHRVCAPGISADLTSLQTVRLFGTGTSLVWIDRSSQTPIIRHLTPAIRRPGNLLRSYNNSRGLESRVSYTAPRQCARRDQEVGNMWSGDAEKLGNIALVERIETRDELSGTRLITSWRYHDGRHDRSRSRLPVFGLVERRDSASVAEFRRPGLFPERPVPDFDSRRRRAPVVTRTWRHLGTKKGSGHEYEYFLHPRHAKRHLLDGHKMPLGPDTEAIIESRRCLYGRVLREEVWGVPEDGPIDIPFQVTEHTYWVREIQSVQVAQPGCFDAHAYESIEAIYECSSDEPRIRRDTTLVIDECGEIIKSSRSTYGPSQRSHELQRGDRVIVSASSVINVADRPTWYRIGVPVENKSFELTFDTLTRAPTRVLVDHKRWRYWSNDLSHITEPGDVESSALLARQEGLVFSPELLRQHLGTDEVGEALCREQGGYLIEGARWWDPGVTITYDANRFYVPTKYVDPLGRTRTRRYESASLNSWEDQDDCGAIVREEIHPRALMPWLSTDANGNCIARRFDALGLPMSTAIMGKPGQLGDSVVIDQLEASAHDDPTAVFTSDLEAWIRQRRALRVRSRRREEHTDRETGVRDERALFNGAGELFCMSTRHSDDSGKDKWAVTKATVRDFQGGIVASIPAFFSDHEYVEPAEIIAATKNATWFKRDWAGRIVRVDYPDGTRATRVYRPWTIVDSDDSDAATPTISLLDGRGRIVVRQHDLGNQLSAEFGFVRAWNAAVVREVDERNRTTQAFAFDLLGRVIGIEQAAGARERIFLAANGEVLARRDVQGRLTRYRYDAAGRLTHAYFSSGVGPETLQERYLYGNVDVVAEASQHNLVGRLYMRLSAVGLETIEGYDFSGNPLRKCLRLPKHPGHSIDWSAIDETFCADQVLSLLKGEQPLLQDVEYALVARFDALGRTVELTAPDNSQLIYRYGTSGGLDRLGFQIQDTADALTVFDNARYDASGRRVSCCLGDGTRVQRRFDSRGRTIQIAASRGDDKRGLQELNFVYGASGPVTAVSDHETLVAAFSYDAARRLTHAEGPSEYVERYTYDNHGNVTELSRTNHSGEWTTRYDYQPESGRLRATSLPDDPANFFTDTYQYDHDGNLSHSPEFNELRWNQYGRLVTVETGDGVLITFEYDVVGDIVRKTTHTPDGVTKETVQLGAFVFKDRQGSQLPKVDSDQALCRQLTDHGQPDHHSGLIYIGNRWYSPRIGRWLSPVYAPAQAPTSARNGTNPYALNSSALPKIVDHDGLDAAKAFAQRAFVFRGHCDVPEFAAWSSVFAI